MPWSPEMKSLVEELSGYERSGCQICLGGKPCRPVDAAAACVREHFRYMRDIESDETDVIRKINFIRIR